MKGLALRPVVALLIVFAIFLSTPALSGKDVALPAMAQQDTSDQSTTDVTYRDPEANLPYLFAVYAITWVVFFAYLYYLSQRQQNLRRELEELREALSERDDQAGGPAHRGMG
jgi:CcmD family protein